MLHAKSCDKFLVHRFVTVLCKDAEKSLPLIESLGGLSHAQGQPVGDQGLLQDLLDGRVDVHCSTSGHGGGRGNISFNIRHVVSLMLKLWKSKVELLESGLTKVNL